jgi:simple sugar transport system permease protein
VLARWQAVEPRVMLLDEPFQGVDVGARADIAAAVRAQTRGRDADRDLRSRRSARSRRPHLLSRRPRSAAVLRAGGGRRFCFDRSFSMSAAPNVSSAPLAASGGARRRLGGFLRRGAVFLLLALLVVVFATAEPAFLGVANFMSVLQAVSVVAILAVGVTISMAVGGFDLSVGAVAASSVMAASYAMVVWRFDATETVALTLAFGLIVGLVNAALIVVVGVPDLLATLAMNFLLTGLQLIPTAGRSIATGLILPSGVSANGAFDPNFLAVGRARLFDVAPIPVLLMIAIGALAFVLTERTRIGRLLFAVGGNEIAARLAGARTERIKTLAYAISATLASLGGVIVAARVGRGDVSSGASLLLDAVAASLIGFAVLAARRPNVFGAVVGAIFVGVLLNGLTMLNVPYYTQDFVKGAVLVGALGLTYGLGRSTT